MLGKKISHYRIIEKIGEGGMGVIYLAEDIRLQREVALKFLPPDLTRDPAARERLIREAQVASALDHPAICTVFEIDQTPDEQMYIAMAYYPGQTLKQKIERGGITYEQALDLTIEIAKGLEKAHEKGVIHRDIKPANIIITRDHFIKIVDFGLAVLSSQTHITTEGIMAVGTVNYMSPEQARNDRVDQRTDIWSLGLVMYEMITGQSAFRGSNPQSVIYSILNDEPEQVQTFEQDIPEKFTVIIDRCLKKDIEERYASMSELLEDLSELQERTRSGFHQDLRVEAEKKRSIAVLPFENLSDDRNQEYFCDGITDEIIHTLGHVNGLRVMARASVFTFKNQVIDIKKIGRQLGVVHILQGSVRSSGDRLRIFVELLAVKDGYTIWSERYDKKSEDVFAIQDDISRSIVENLKGTLLAEEKDVLEKHPTKSIEAYHLYLQGYYFLNKRTSAGLKKGMGYFNQAVSKDPYYAPARVGLADAYILFAGYELMPPVQAYPLARTAVTRALEQDNSMAWGHSMLAILYWEDSRDQVSAEQEFCQAIDLAPGMAILHHAYAEFLSILGRYEQAFTEVNLALQLDPLSLISHVLKGFNFYLMRRYDQAIKHYHSVIEMDPNFITACCELGMTLIQYGQYKDGIRALERAVELSQNSPMFLSRLAYGLGISGNRGKALKMLDQLTRISEDTFVSPFSMAIIHLGLGDNEKAIPYLEKAFAEKMYHMLLLKTDPLFEPVRSDPRIRKLLLKLGFSENHSD